MALLSSITACKLKLPINADAELTLKLLPSVVTDDQIERSPDSNPSVKIGSTIGVGVTVGVNVFVGSGVFVAVAVLVAVAVDVLVFIGVVVPIEVGVNVLVEDRVGDNEVAIFVGVDVN